jgi:diaminopimelate epimerase
VIPESPATGAIDFDKYQATGNDFVVLDGADGVLPPPAPAIAAMCDRRRGVGADGVLVVTSPPAGPPRASMVVYNADGTRPEMCGNGLRCAALHVARRRFSAPCSCEVLVQTDSGPRPCLVELEADLACARVTADLGEVSAPEARRARVGGRHLDLLLVSIGNPHAVIVCEPGAEDIDELGPALARDASFADGVNVEIASARGPGRLEVLVWERGVGRTLACGTGACAAVAAASSRGLLPSAGWVSVAMPGGPLEVALHEGSRRASLRGEAEHVFSGKLRLR